MKIAILSMQRVYNYGSVLQAYSLKKMTENICHETVDFLDPSYEEYVLTNMPVQDLQDYSGKAYISNPLAYYWKKGINKFKYKKFRKEIEKFQCEELHLSASNKDKHYDLVIEGSDEVFKATKRVVFNFYGKVENTDKLIGYATSCGSAVYEGIPKEHLAEIEKYMEKFSAMSVRDKHTLEYIRNLYHRPIECHMDPVLMGELYQRQHPKVKYKNYMVVYAYGERIRTKEEICAIKTFARKHHLKIVALGAPQYWADVFQAVSPFTMLDYFYHASYVVTDTFHGAVFSIINHCQFAVILRNSNQHKLSGLLQQLRLENRLLTSMDNLENILTTEIDYSVTDTILEKERNRAKDYLQRHCVK